MLALKLKMKDKKRTFSKGKMFQPFILLASILFVTSANQRKETRQL